MKTSHCLILALALSMSTACAHGRIIVLHDPLSAGDHNDLGVAYLGQEKPDLAEREFRLAIRMDGTLAAAHYNLGLVYHRQRQWGKAERAYRATLVRDSRSAAARNNLALVLIATKGDRRLAEAAALAEQAAALDPEQAFRYYDTRGTVAEASGDLGAAERWYREALAAVPQPPADERLAIERRLGAITELKVKGAPRLSRCPF